MRILPSKSYYEKHKEELKAKARANYYANKEKRAKQCKQYRLTHKEELARLGRIYYLKTRDKQRAYKIIHERNRSQALKTKIYELLGDTCVRCGFADKRALQIDHINGHGGQLLKGICTQKYYRSIIAMSDIERKATYQILCANCNWIKKAENNEVKTSVSTSGTEITLKTT